MAFTKASIIPWFARHLFANIPRVESGRLPGTSTPLPVLEASIDFCRTVLKTKEFSVKDLPLLMPLLPINDVPRKLRNQIDIDRTLIELAHPFYASPSIESIILGN